MAIKTECISHPNEIHWPLYFGPIDRSKMTKEELRGYEIYCGQKKRCSNKNLTGYGKKGIKVNYSAREFIGWWIFNAYLKKYKWPTCGRKNHDIGYSFDNIEIQEMGYNSSEAAVRNNLKRFGTKLSLPVISKNKNTGEKRRHESIRAAATECGVSQRLVQFYVRGIYKDSNRNKWVFIYE